MVTYRITEDYGVYGPENEVRFRTSTLLSCSAIIMYNSATTILGLFHYGALTLGSTNVQNTIVQMVNDIRPTDMVLWPANISGQFENERDRMSVKLDNAKVRQFLLNIKGGACSFVQKADETFPGVRANGALVFGGLAGEQAMPDIAVGKTVQGNIAFFFCGNSTASKYSGDVANAVSRILEIEADARYG